jgi:hypothetical protein
MKPLAIIILLLSTSLGVYAQSGANTIGTTGNVIIGTSASNNSLTVNGLFTQTGGAVSSTSALQTYLQVNAANSGSQTNLNPGLLLYNSTVYSYGIDLGYCSSSNRFRSRIFSQYGADVALSYVNTTASPTAQSNFTDGLIMLGGSGNILIGKTTQTNSSYKLDVAGTVRANQLVINTTGADYVFDSAYQLPSLAKVYSYVQSYHHLPQIASAYDMQTNGLNVGENQTQLLQKIEELTLYAIEADKRIQQLEASNKHQQALLEEQQKTLKAQQELLLKLSEKLNNPV